MTPTETITGYADLYNADCAQVMADMPDGAVECVITDPPYSARTHAGHDSITSRKANDGGYDGARRKELGYAPWSVDDVNKYVPEMCRVASGWVLVMTDHTLAPSIARAMESAGRYVFQPLPFVTPGGRVRLSGDGPSSWTDWIIVCRTAKQHRWGTLPGAYIAGPGWRDRKHMGGKPVALCRALVRDYTRDGDTVLDPFMGAASSLVAALKEGRRAIGVEIDEKYYAPAAERIRAACGRVEHGFF